MCAIGPLVVRAAAVGGHNATMGSSGPRRRKPKQVLPPLHDYVKPPWGSRYWRLGGPLTRDHEAEAAAARAAKQPSRMGQWVLKVLGYRPPKG
jgi:hypothetical protein